MRWGSPSSRAILSTEASVFDPEPGWLGRFWLVRAANILNKEYFSADRLEAGVRNAMSYVCAGGYLLLNRTADPLPRNDGTLLQRLPDETWVPIKRFGNGSEVEALVTGKQG